MTRAQGTASYLGTQGCLVVGGEHGAGREPASSPAPPGNPALPCPAEHFTFREGPLGFRLPILSQLWGRSGLGVAALIFTDKLCRVLGRPWGMPDVWCGGGSQGLLSGSRRPAEHHRAPCPAAAPVPPAPFAPPVLRRELQQPGRAHQGRAKWQGASEGLVVSAFLNIPGLRSYNVAKAPSWLFVTEWEAGRLLFGSINGDEGSADIDRASGMD